MTIFAPHEATFNGRFRDRTHAGQVLADHLMHYAGHSDLQILALPRGGVPVAYEVATGLHAPLDVLIVRKLGIPGHEEVAFGALAEHNIKVIHEDIARRAGLTPDLIDWVIRKEAAELTRRKSLYGGSRPPADLAEKTVILIDDGLATGATMQAAIEVVKQQRPRRLVVAAPVAAPEVCEEMRGRVDEMICALTPDPFYAVGLWYEYFPQTSDTEVLTLLERAARGEAALRPQAEKN